MNNQGKLESVFSGAVYGESGCKDRKRGRKILSPSCVFAKGGNKEAHLGSFFAAVLVNMLMHKLKLLIPRALAGAKFDFVMERELLTGVYVHYTKYLAAHPYCKPPLHTGPIDLR